jgi:hypothetical protein
MGARRRLALFKNGILYGRHTPESYLDDGCIEETPFTISPKGIL